MLDYSLVTVGPHEIVTGKVLAVNSPTTRAGPLESPFERVSERGDQRDLFREHLGTHE